MDEVSTRKYDTTEVINVGTLKDDFGVKDIKEIEQSELQSFLTGDPVLEEDIDDLEKVKQPQEEDTDEDGDIPTVRKERKKPAKKPDIPNEDDVDGYLNDEPTSAKKPEGKKKDNNPPSANGDDENIFTTLNRDLMKNGIFSEDTEEVKDAEGFKNRFVKEMHKGANSILEQFLSQHGPEYREAFESIFVNGVNPETYFKHIERIENLEGMDLKDAGNQERILRNFYKAKGFSDARIDKKLDNLKNFGELEEEASAVHEVMLKEETERLEEEKERAEVDAAKRAQNKQNYKSSIQRILNDKIKSKSFDGIPIDPNVAHKIYKNLTEDAYSLPDGTLITEFQKAILDLDRPDNFEKKLKLALLLNSNLDLSVVKKEAIKNETNETFAGIQRMRAKKEIPSSDSFKSFF